MSQMEAYTEGRGEFGEDGRFRCNTHVTRKLVSAEYLVVVYHLCMSTNIPFDLTVGGL